MNDLSALPLNERFAAFEGSLRAEIYKHSVLAMRAFVLGLVLALIKKISGLEAIVFLEFFLIIGGAVGIVYCLALRRSIKELTPPQDESSLEQAIVLHHFKTTIVITKRTALYAFFVAALPMLGALVDGKLMILAVLFTVAIALFYQLSAMNSFFMFLVRYDRLMGRQYGEGRTGEYHANVIARRVAERAPRWMLFVAPIGMVASLLVGSAYPATLMPLMGWFAAMHPIVTLVRRYIIYTLLRAELEEYYA